MNITEAKAKKWLIREKGLQLGEIKKARGSPDFETPLGGYEVKRLYGDAIMFSAVQIEELQSKTGTTVLVFNHGDEPVDVIPFEMIDFRVKMWGKIRIITDTTRTIKLEDKVYDKLTGMMRPKETYSQIVERILLMCDKLGELRDVLEGVVAFKKGQLERLNRSTLGDVIGTNLEGKPLIERRSEP